MADLSNYSPKQVFSEIDDNFKGGDYLSRFCSLVAGLEKYGKDVKLTNSATSKEKSVYDILCGKDGFLYPIAKNDLLENHNKKWFNVWIGNGPVFKARGWIAGQHASKLSNEVSTLTSIKSNWNKQKESLKNYKEGLLQFTGWSKFLSELTVEMDKFAKLSFTEKSLSEESKGLTLAE